MLLGASSRGLGAALVMVALTLPVGMPVEAGAKDKITLHLVYTSDTNGYVDPCG